MNDSTRQCAKQVLLVFSLLVAGASFATAQVAEKEQTEKKFDPTAKEIIEKYIEATGGREAYESFEKNTVAKGEIGLGMEITGEFVSYSAPPDLTKMIITVEQFGEFIHATGKGQGWDSSLMGGNRLVKGAELAQRLRDAKYDKFLHLADLYDELELAGSETISIEMHGEETPSKHECWKIVATPPEGEGEPETLYFDKESKLLLRQAGIGDSQMGRVTYKSDMTRYSKYGDALVADRIRTTSSVQEIRIEINSIETDVDLPEDTFEPPAAIQKLIEAEKKKDDAEGDGQKAGGQSR